MTLLATPSSAQLIPSSPFLDVKSSIQDVKRREISKSTINIRRIEETSEKTSQKQAETPRSKSVATLQPSKTKMATNKNSNPNSGTSTPKKEPPSSPFKIGGFGASLKSKLKAIGSPLKTKSAPATPEPSKKGRKSRRMSAAAAVGSSRNLQTPTVQVNDSSVDLDQVVGGMRPRMARSARPGRLTSASSLKKHKKKKRRSKSEAVLQEKKKDKWADYAMQYANDIEMESGVQPKDKWDKYVKNCIEASESPLLKKAEKKIEKKTTKVDYSSDEKSSENESESDSDEKKGKKKAKKKSTKSTNKSKEKTRKLSKNEMKNMFTAAGDDVTSESESESDSEDENDLHARLLASMEKDVIPEESEEDLTTPRQPKNDIVAKTTAPIPVKTQTKPPQKVVETTKTPKQPAATKPKEKPKVKSVKKTENKLVTPNETANKNHQNGPIVDFHEQIRKISTAHGQQAPDLSQLDIPEKHKTSSQTEDDIHNAIDDILQEEEKARPKTGTKSRRDSAKTLASPSATNSSPENEEAKLRALEESILKNHGKQKPGDELTKKGSEVDELISELNLDT